jgi:hypothetical protein
MRCRFQFEAAWGEGDSAASRVVLRSAGHLRASFNSECRPVLEVGVGVKHQAFETETTFQGQGRAQARGTKKEPVRHRQPGKIDTAKRRLPDACGLGYNDAMATQC